MTAVILQARMGSTRLPGKALLPLGGSTVVEQAMARLALVPADALVLATDEASASDLAPAAERRGFRLLVGPADDVLARYCLAVRRFGVDIAIRATGDNPFVSHELAALLLERASRVASDYAGFVGMPIGMGVEVVCAEALLRAEAEAVDPYDREHVCPYLYGHPELFRVDRPKAPPEYALDSRLTVDTESDYERCLRIYGALYDGRPIPTAALIEHLRGCAQGGHS